jgi:ethanolamine utilization cobalamin adenosyltransferase
MNTFKIDRHKNGLFYVVGRNVSDSFVAVNLEDYCDLADRLEKLRSDHERNLGLLKILLKANHLENFINVE